MSRLTRETLSQTGPIPTTATISTLSIPSDIHVALACKMSSLLRIFGELNSHNIVCKLTRSNPLLVLHSFLLLVVCPPALRLLNAWFLLLPACVDAMIVADRSKHRLSHFSVSPVNSYPIHKVTEQVLLGIRDGANVGDDEFGYGRPFHDRTCFAGAAIGTVPR